MAGTKQRGKDILMYFDFTTAITAAKGTATNYKLAGCLTDGGFSLGVDELTQTRTKCDGDNPATEPGNETYSASGSGVQTLFSTEEQASYHTMQAIKDKLLSKAKFWVKEANTVTGETTEFVGWLNSFTTSAGEDGEATFDFDITGHSKLQFAVVV